MADYKDTLAALAEFRNQLVRPRRFGTEAAAVRALAFSDGSTIARPQTAQAFARNDAFPTTETAGTNIHATGVGIRSKDGEYLPDQHVLKLYVYKKIAGVNFPSEWQGVPVDVEELPVQVPRSATTYLPPARLQRFAQAPGGVSISPLNVSFTGTLGCYLERNQAGVREVFVLSNNHVLADVDRLPAGTQIAQPGPENPRFATQAGDVFAELHMAIPLQFPDTQLQPGLNRFDAAIAKVTDMGRICTGKMLDIPTYDPSAIKAAFPGMRVMKSGRSTGVTHGTITGTNADGFAVNYGTFAAPRIAKFSKSIRIVGDAAASFSNVGDSGSVILEEESGNPVAVLFAGDPTQTTACDFGDLCTQLQAWPI